MEFAPTAEIKNNLSFLKLSENLTTRILAIHDGLKKTSLHPSPKINTLFKELVALAKTKEALSRSVLLDKQLGKIRGSLQRICAVGEFYLEKFWAEKIVAGKNPLRVLEKFPYMDNYRDLINLEMRAVADAGAGKIKKVLLIGSGPLPLSAIVIAENYKIPVDCLDIDLRACRLSYKVIKALGLESIIKIYRGDVLKFKNFNDYDLIILGALVGQNIFEKKKIIRFLEKWIPHRSWLLGRSANLLRTLLYPEITPEYFGKMAVKKVVHPRNDVINSVIVAKK